MFPIVSNLRRSAMKIIYTETPDVVLKGGTHFSLDVSTGKWEKVNRPFMSEVSVSSDSAAERATKLCVFENELFDSSELGKLQYTLIFGRELEEGSTRTVRFGVVKGIFMAEKGAVVRNSQPSSSAPRRRPLPDGVIVDER